MTSLESREVERKEGIKKVKTATRKQNKGLSRSEKLDKEYQDI